MEGTKAAGNGCPFNSSLLITPGFPELSRQILFTEYPSGLLPCSGVRVGILPTLHHRDYEVVEMFKRAGMGVLALALIFSAALTTAPAQEKTQTKTKAGGKIVEGELVSIDAKKLTAVVKTDSGNQTVALG